MNAPGVNRWVAGARPRTLPARSCRCSSARPAPSGEGDAHRLAGAGRRVVALALQIGTNYANDYSDGVRGTDDASGSGPVRLVASGLASPGAVKRAALARFGVAALAGMALAAGHDAVAVPGRRASPSPPAGSTPAGPKPYGYYGFGELFVFVFFGLVATAGSTFVQLERITGLSVAAGAAVGFAATALLVVNNLRDIPTDRVAGKQTLAVRLGDQRDPRRSTSCWSLGPCSWPPLTGARPAARAARRGRSAIFATAPAAGGRAGRHGPPLDPGARRHRPVQLVFGVLFAVGLGRALRPTCLHRRAAAG